jgi:ferritin
MIKNFSHYINESIENDPRISTELTKLLNNQIKNELTASQMYRGMACWLDDKQLTEASLYFFTSAQEELTHQDKIYKYLFDRNCLAKVPSVDEPKQDYSDLRTVLNAALEAEIFTTKCWNEIAELAKKENDNVTYEFSLWFSKEQVEDEGKIRDLIFFLNLDTPQYEMEIKFKELNQK